MIPWLLWPCSLHPFYSYVILCSQAWEWENREASCLSMQNCTYGCLHPTLPNLLKLACNGEAMDPNQIFEKVMHLKWHSESPVTGSTGGEVVQDLLPLICCCLIWGFMGNVSHVSSCICWLWFLLHSNLSWLTLSWLLSFVSSCARSAVHWAGLDSTNPAVLIFQFWF